MVDEEFSENDASETPERSQKFTMMFSTDVYVAAHMHPTLN